MIGCQIIYSGCRTLPIFPCRPYPKRARRRANLLARCPLAPRRDCTGAAMISEPVIAIALPPGNEGQIGLARGCHPARRHRAELAWNDRRGLSRRITSILVNLGAEPFIIRRGMRIAQLVSYLYNTRSLLNRSTLYVTQRDASGFGSTEWRRILSIRKTKANCN